MNYDEQKAIMSTIHSAQSFLRNGYFKPERTNIVIGLIKRWKEDITDPRLVKVLNELQEAEISKLK